MTRPLAMPSFRRFFTSPSQESKRLLIQSPQSATFKEVASSAPKANLSWAESSWDWCSWPRWRIPPGVRPRRNCCWSPRAGRPSAGHPRIRRRPEGAGEVPGASRRPGSHAVQGHRALEGRARAAGAGRRRGAVRHRRAPSGSRPTRAGSRRWRRWRARGGGLVVLHWAMGTREAQPIDDFLQLFGGCHGGPDRKYQVRGNRGQGRRRRSIPSPPASRLQDQGRVLLPAQVRQAGRQRPAGAAGQHRWPDGNRGLAWERPDGGRSFGFCGLHFHDNWGRAEYRRLVAQGVLWTMKLEIPKEGLAVEVKR